MQPTSNNKRIAKNTLLLYVRMLFTIVIGLYTSRVVLNVLGVSDYGVYNVVGGIVAMTAFLNSALTAASQRFISYELGTDDKEQQNITFSTSVTIHILMALIIFVVAETFGLWFLNTHLNIEENRMVAANWVYQCSILSMMLTVMSVPYNACIVAHEHMRAFAYIGIMETISKLLVVYLLLVINSDKLITYAILIFLVSLIVRFTYGLYCKHKFEECTYHFMFDKKTFKDMFSFAGWSIVGNFGFCMKDQGLNIVLNLFFGVMVNAARGVAVQVNALIGNFSSNFTMALNPQITKQYAAGNIGESMKLVYTGCRFSFYLMAFIATPVLVNLDYLLRLWLGIVPNYTVQFLALSLIVGMINAMVSPITTALQATGRIALFQTLICGLMLCELPLAYFILHNGGKPYTAVYPSIFIAFIALFVRFLLLKRQIPLYRLRYFTLSIVGKNMFLAFVGIILSIVVRKQFHDNFLSFIITSFLSCIFMGMIFYSFGLKISERHAINIKFKHQIFEK